MRDQAGVELLDRLALVTVELEPVLALLDRDVGLIEALHRRHQRDGLLAHTTLRLDRLTQAPIQGLVDRGGLGADGVGPRLQRVELGLGHLELQRGALVLVAQHLEPAAHGVGELVDVLLDLLARGLGHQLEDLLALGLELGERAGHDRRHHGVHVLPTLDLLGEALLTRGHRGLGGHLVGPALREQRLVLFELGARHAPGEREKQERT